MTDIEQILEELRVFNRERDWDQFHNGKDLADKYNLDIKEIMLEKIRKNAAKYPVDKAKGSAKKYNEI